MSKRKPTLDDALDAEVQKLEEVPEEVLPTETLMRGMLAKAEEPVDAGPLTLCNVCGKYFTGTSTAHALSEHK
jgi:hypothetical protein